MTDGHCSRSGEVTASGAGDDMIKVGNIGTEDEPKLVSTIENVTGGFGSDMLTGDARANTLKQGGAYAARGGDDALTGGAGDDTLSRRQRHAHGRRW